MKTKLQLARDEQFRLFFSKLTTPHNREKRFYSALDHIAYVARQEGREEERKNLEMELKSKAISNHGLTISSINELFDKLTGKEEGKE